MKRFKDRLLVNFWNDFGFLFIIFLMLGVGIWILCFRTIDTAPATEADFKPLQDQRIAFEKDHNTLFNSDCIVKIEDGVISVTFENDECLLTATYNEAFENISIIRSDKAKSWPFVIFAFLGTCVVGTFIFFGLLLLIIMGIGELMLKVKKIQNFKDKIQI